MRKINISKIIIFTFIILVPIITSELDKLEIIEELFPSPLRDKNMMLVCLEVCEVTANIIFLCYFIVLKIGICVVLRLFQVYLY